MNTRMILIIALINGLWTNSLNLTFDFAVRILLIEIPSDYQESNVRNSYGYFHIHNNYYAQKHLNYRNKNHYKAIFTTDKTLENSISHDQPIFAKTENEYKQIFDSKIEKSEEKSVNFYIKNKKDNFKIDKKIIVENYKTLFDLKYFTKNLYSHKLMQPKFQKVCNSILKNKFQKIGFCVFKVGKNIEIKGKNYLVLPKSKLINPTELFNSKIKINFKIFSKKIQKILQIIFKLKNVKKILKNQEIGKEFIAKKINEIGHLISANWKGIPNNLIKFQFSKKNCYFLLMEEKLHLRNIIAYFLVGVLVVYYYVNEWIKVRKSDTTRKLGEDVLKLLTNIKQTILEKLKELFTRNKKLNKIEYDSEIIIK